MPHEPSARAPRLRVADFSRVLAGPYATMMLADFGADVIKIESPAGDDTRQWLPPTDAQGASTYFGAVNRNKRSVVCDLGTVEGRAAAWRLATTADVVVENFRPGVMERFGLGYEAVRAANPGVVYCSITGFGAGAGARLPGYDLLVQAVGGLMSVTGPVDGEPSKVGVALVDVLAGLNALSGILLALRERDSRGDAGAAEATGPGGASGGRVEVDLLTTLLSALTNQAAGTLATGHSPARLGNAHPSIAPYELFAASDRDLVIAVGTDSQFRTLVRLLGAPGLATDPRFLGNADRVRHRADLRPALEALLRAHPAAHWVDTLTDAGVPAGLVNSISEAFAFAEGLGTASVVELVSGSDPRRVSRQVANPIHLGDRPAGYLLPPPRLGEHAGADWLGPDAHSALGAAASAEPAPAPVPAPAFRPTPAPPTALRRTEQDLS
ncbi:CoA transferase [Cryobacterium sp. RTC2.1]|uniref:CaiB/BaiF CoA transferase family protein n=1 Tax=Cryobacterium sp. RTC2.1 TaxID=3048634 RepID=UPI002B22EB7A|nr:CoA transferase [Cryobacterium sp. RTC2.1]MEB0002697.1 CoA transferase [Cryobacterium sp. RTC2.1]